MALPCGPKSILAACLVVLSSAASANETRPFPLAVRSDPGATMLELAPVPGALADLQALTSVRLADVPLPGGRTVTLELQRVTLAAQDAALVVDGRPQAGALDASITLWGGHVEGDPGAAAYLAFSPHGSRGWVMADGRLVHLVAQPDVQQGWAAPRQFWATEDALLAAGARPELPCKAMDVVSPRAPQLPRVAAAGPGDGGSPLPLLECRMVVESDHEYYQVFNDLGAATAYALALLGAVSDRYREQIGVILTVPYLALYTTPADPWFWSSNGGNCIDVLYEFQAAWAPGFGGSPPAPGDVYHMLSGADLGCGVAWLPGLCNPDYGFAVSGNLSGATPFPVSAGPLNWDFIVVAHEIGHNFDAIHTHSYCPPLDQCAPSGYFGPCQSQQVCTTQGTVMSYCHICDAGMSNMTTYFHAQSVADMRAMAETCLAPFEGVLANDLGFAKPGAGGVPSLSVSYTPSPDTLHLDATGLPPSKPGALFLSPNALYAPFKGGVLVPGTELLVTLVSPPSGSLPLALPVTGSFPTGVTGYAQEWFKDTGPGYAATNGVRFELIVP
jgi:hypothetical protein